MVRTTLCKRYGTTLQHRPHNIHSAPLRCTYLGPLPQRKGWRAQMAGYCRGSIGRSFGYSLLRLRSYERVARYYCSCSNIRRNNVAQGRKARNKPAHNKHHPAVPAGDNDRLLVVRSNCCALGGQHPYGPELARGHFHSRRLPGTRAVRFTPTALRASIQFGD